MFERAANPPDQRRSVRAKVRLIGLRLAGNFYTEQTPSPVPHAVLLIRPDHLGDMLFVTPALHWLREALPMARLALLAGPWGASAMRGNPDLDEVRLCPFPGFARGRQRHPFAPYFLLRQAARELRGEGYDTAVVLRFDHWWGAWLAAAAGIPRRVGYLLPETEPFLTEPVAHSRGHHEVEQNQFLLARLAPPRLPTAAPGNAALPDSPGARPGGDKPGRLRFTVSAEDQAWAEEWLAARHIDLRRPLVAIHVGAGARVKQWPLASWASVADGLAAEASAQILLTGGRDEFAQGAGIQAAMSTPALNAVGETTLGQLAALQTRCALVVGSDCGPLHLAVAVGRPTVHLHGPVAATSFGPWGDPARQRVVTAPSACAPCNRLDWPAADLQYHCCMAAITPRRVLAECMQALSGETPLGPSGSFVSGSSRHAGTS
jgi:heptosyltransferase-2/heptosyltransferase-3